MKEVVIILISLFWVLCSPLVYMDELHINFWVTGIICITQAIGWIFLLEYFKSK